MPNTASFSVLLSLYHKESPLFLDLCFQSLQSQTILANEIILVIDGPIGSDLKETVTKWVNILPITIIPINENIGLGRALNIGIHNCSHEWIFRMDTDDICVSNRFEKQLQFISNNADIVLFGGQILEFNASVEDAVSIKFVPESLKDIKKFSINRCPFNHMTVAYRKSVISQLGGYQHHLFMEDYNLWLRVIGNNYKVANLPDILLYARVGNGMYKRRRGWEYIKSEKQLAKLKYKLEIQNYFASYISFIIRSIARLLPSKLLGIFYTKLLRKSFNKN